MATNSTALVAKDAVTQFEVILAPRKETLQLLCPEHVNSERIIRSVVSAIYQSEKLAKCSPRSIVIATGLCCQYGLEPDTPLQQCHLVPFAGEVKVIPGYRGLVTLAHNSGEIAGIVSRPVFVDEKFSLVYRETGASMEHIPNLDPEGDDEQRELRLVYCVITLLNGKVLDPVTMSKKEITRIMNGARGAADADSPWKRHFVQMALKTVLKRAMKYVPLSPDKAQRYASLVQHEDQVLYDSKAGLSSEERDMATQLNVDDKRTKSQRVAEEMAPVDPFPDHVARLAPNEEVFPPEESKPSVNRELERPPEETARPRPTRATSFETDWSVDPRLLMEISGMVEELGRIETLVIPDLRVEVSVMLRKMDSAFLSKIRSKAISAGHLPSGDVSKYKKTDLVNLLCYLTLALR